MPKGEGNVVAQNKKARHDYSIVDTIEAGIVLTGTEIKSVRAARIQLKDGYAQIKNGEAWLINVHIAPFEQGNIWNQDPDRTRKLLLKKKQITKLQNDQGNRNDLGSFEGIPKKRFCQGIAWYCQRET